VRKTNVISVFFIFNYFYFHNLISVSTKSCGCFLVMLRSNALGCVIGFGDEIGTENGTKT